MDALSSQLESVSLLRERSLSSALERLSQLDVHCVVCTLEFGDRDREDEYARLERVRETNSAVPVVAAIGSDEGGSTARERITTALESGATDVVSAADPPELVATRVRNAAERFRRDRATSDRERSILEGSDALVWVVAEDGTLEYASGATETRLGYTPDELEGTPLVRLVHPDDRERLGETIERVSSAPFGATERTTARVGRPDGRWQASELAWTNRLADPVVDGIVVTLSAVGSASADDAPPTPLARRRLEPPSTDSRRRCSRSVRSGSFVTPTRRRVSCSGRIPNPGRSSGRCSTTPSAVSSPNGFARRRRPTASSRSRLTFRPSSRASRSRFTPTTTA